MNTDHLRAFSDAQSLGFKLSIPRGILNWSSTLFNYLLVCFYCAMGAFPVGNVIWWIFLILGIAGVIASLSIDNVILSSLLGVFAFSSFWTIKEVFEQEERVKKGWFPKNPKRKYKF